jgi:DMSO/TMAO reductase YedYZ molybdopterin-dependent catalytic subunit
MKKQMQITEHSCIQGWTAIGEWRGVSMNYIISLCRASSNIRTNSLGTVIIASCPFFFKFMIIPVTL